jgi:hypothetical protein
MSEFGVTESGQLDLSAGLWDTAPPWDTAPWDTAGPGEQMLDGLAPEQGGDEWWFDPAWIPGDERYADPDPADEDFDEEAEHASWLAGLPADVRADYEAGPWTGEGESLAPGSCTGTGMATGAGPDSHPAAPWTRSCLGRCWRS